MEGLRKIKADLNAAGLIFAGVESHPVPAEKIKLGLPGRDEEIENYFAAIRALAQFGVPALLQLDGRYRLVPDANRPSRPRRRLLSEFDDATAKRQGSPSGAKSPKPASGAISSIS